MSSRWVLQSDGESAEPLAFDRLAQMLADGSLQDSDLVRPEQGRDWQTADSVIGLFRAAWQLRDAALKEPGRVAVTEEVNSRHGASGHNEQQAGSLLNERSRRSISVTRTVVLSLLLAAVCWYLWSVWHESRRFPVPAHAQTRPVPWSLPLLGPVSNFEVGLLAFDGVAVVVFAAWWLRSRRGAQ